VGGDVLEEAAGSRREAACRNQASTMARRQRRSSVCDRAVVAFYLGMHNDHTTLGPIESTKKTILHRHWKTLESIGKYFQAL